MERRGFLGMSLAVVSGAAGFFASIPFVKSFLPSAKARGLAGPIEVDLSGLKPGQVSAHSYRGDTMLVLRRTAEMLAQLDSMKEHRNDDGTTIDPPYVDSRTRAINPEYLVVRGPAPRDLPIPPHRYAAATRLVIGEPTEIT